MKYVRTFLIFGTISILLMAWRGLFTNTNPLRAYRILSDAFFVPSVLLLGGGLLSLAKADGFFDAVSYSFLWIRHAVLSKQGSKGMPVKDLYEYRKMKNERRGFKPHLILAGLVFLAAASVFQYLFTTLHY